ncbi:hypothetical protein KW807_02455, partial [Candidatus Parcubacteria bacterium]|nr:hypothetical protein [Candidatus Parcubacteria bacterium]
GEPLFPRLSHILLPSNISRIVVSRRELLPAPEMFFSRPLEENERLMFKVFQGSPPPLFSDPKSPIWTEGLVSIENLHIDTNTGGVCTVVLRQGVSIPIGGSCVLVKLPHTSLGM